MRFDRLKKREFITLLGGAVATTLLRKAVLAADPLIFEIISVQADLDQRTGQPTVSIRLKDQRPFTRLEAEKQVLRTLELRVDGTAIFKAVIRDPPYVGALFLAQTGGSLRRGDMSAIGGQLDSQPTWLSASSLAPDGASYWLSSAESATLR
jgi:hypothetical protein